VCLTNVGCSHKNMTTLTIDEAIKLVPAIGATSPANNVSGTYQFVSTRAILERVQQDGWLITNATSQGRKEHAQHRVTLVHQDNFFDNGSQPEGIPRIEMFNSHNLTKRLMFAIGYFRFVCSNGLIIANGPAETIRTKHRFSDDRLSVIMEQVAQISNRFPSINNKIEQFKSRQLTEEEQMSFAEYAIKGRFNYRPLMPKRFEDIKVSSQKLLQSRREADQGDSAWQVYNRVQENLITGVEGFTRPIKGYTDSVRVNQLLWKGTEMTLQFDRQKLNQSLMELLVKDGKKGKISA
jgi:hypothetical protein